MRLPERRRARAGFTLIELLAVLIIISILAALLVTNLGGAQSAMEEKLTKERITEIATALLVYSDEVGDYPPSTLKAEETGRPNPMNLGAECLYLGLCKEDGPGYGVLDEHIDNTDADQLAKRLPGFNSLELFEIVDDWGNPIAYFHNRDYGREDLYTTFDGETGEMIETTAKARKNEKTGRWYKPTGFQLISAGLDGAFGTEDDITNF